VAYFVYESKNAGFMALVNLFALISLGLAIFNFLPIPPLDGSRMLYSVIELIMGKKISPKVQMTIDNIGVILLFMFIIFVTYNDILRMFK
jgi:regulator of sigma E protease